MRIRAASRLAWVVCAVVLLILASSLLLILLGWSTPLPRGWTPWRDQILTLVGIVGAPILGGLVASRRPDNPYGWLWLGFGLGLALQLLAESYAAYALVVEPGSLAAPRMVSQLLALGGPLALTFAPFLLLLFPTGRLPSPRWRILAWVAVISGAVLLYLNFLFDSPEKAGGLVTITVMAVVVLIFAAVVLSALSLVVRYYRASGVERQQLKWFALAAVLAACFLVGELLSLDRLLGHTLWNLLDAATNTGLYLAIGVAILRHRLYDIDVIINRTLVYGVLTGTLAVVYLGSVIFLQFFFRALTGDESQLAIVASTLAIAALFGPLRRRIQDAIDRRFYRKKYSAARTLEAFSAKLRDDVDIGTLTDDMISVIRETIQPAHVSLWLRTPSRIDPPAAGGRR